MKALGLLAVLGLAFSLGGQAAHAEMMFVTPSGSSVIDGGVNAQAAFTLSDGLVTIQLTNREQNLKSAGQELSGLIFDISGATGNGSLSTVNSGLISTITTKGGLKGTYTAGVADSLTSWQASELGTTIVLNDLTGGKPSRLIIGPDDQGGFDQLGLYSAANSSVSQHNKHVLGTGTFAISVPGVTESSSVSNVFFQFSSSPGVFNGATGGGYVQAVPEPSTAVLLGVAVVAGLGTAAWRRRARSIK